MVGRRAAGAGLAGEVGAAIGEKWNREWWGEWAPSASALCSRVDNTDFTFTTKIWDLGLVEIHQNFKFFHSLHHISF